jgi:chemotaxis signal transduction protein
MDVFTNVSVNLEASPEPIQSLQDRFIMAQVGQRQLAFPSPYVAEILLVERSQLLTIPFYEAALLGVVHHHGKIVPLVSIHPILEESPGSIREMIDVIQLGEDVGSIAGIGIVVDRVLESQSREQLADEFVDPSISGLQSPMGIQLFRPDLLSDRLWIPKRWGTSSMY